MASKEKKSKARDEKGESEFVRRFKANPLIFVGSFIILILVVIAFVMPSSVGMGYGNAPDLTFGRYDGVPIAYARGNYLARYYEMALSYYQNSMNSENMAYMSYQIWNDAFQAAAVNTAMLQEVKKSGYAPPKNLVDREVARLPQFQENGRFSRARYNQYNSNEQRILWQQIRDEITVRHFNSDTEALLTPAAEGEFIGKMATAQRSFEMALFPVDDYPDFEYEAFALENADLFRSAHLSIITVTSNKREAQSILTSIKNGETTFEDAAKARLESPYADRGGDMGVRIAYELETEIPDESVRETALALTAGEISDVIKNAEGWSIFRAEDDVQEADIGDPATLDRVRAYVRNFRRGRMEDWAIDRAAAFTQLVNEHGFDEAVSMQGIEKRSFGPVPLNYGNVDLFPTLASQSVNEISNSATNPLFWSAAFATPVGSPSQPIVQGNNVLVLLPIDETEADEESIESITSYYNSYWLSNISGQALGQYFLNSPKMKNDFVEVYLRNFAGQDN